MRPFRRYWLGGLAIGLAVGSGCAEELGPEPMRTTRVVGLVVEGSRPVGGGWIEFHPVAGTVGNLRSAPIGPDGSFQANGVAVGLNRIELHHAPVDRPFTGLFSSARSPIRRRIDETPARALTIDLIEEATRPSQKQPRGRAPASPGDDPNAHPLRPARPDDRP